MSRAVLAEASSIFTERRSILGSVSRALLENLRPFHGHVFPVNPNHAMVLEEKTFSTITDVPEDVGLAVIATPAATVPGIVGECAAAEVKNAVIISAGFKECEPAHAELVDKRLRKGSGDIR